MAMAMAMVVLEIRRPMEEKGRGATEEQPCSLLRPIWMLH
jgi:hypothetical protein